MKPLKSPCREGRRAHRFRSRKTRGELTIRDHGDETCWWCKKTFRQVQREQRGVETVGSPLSRVVKINKTYPISKHGNIRYELKLKCGHIVWRTYKPDVDPVSKYCKCIYCFIKEKKLNGEET